MPANCKLQIANRKSGFTLVELLVVILIIGILVGILIPVVTKIKTKGYAATTLAQINALRGAIEAYQGTYNAYPGPIPDHYMYQLPPGTPPLPTGVQPSPMGNSQMTQHENAVLGIMGGLSLVGGVVTFNPNDVGNGPRNLSPGNPAQHAPFYNNTKELTQGFFSDKVDGAGKPIASCYDSSVPEFVDRFSEPLPILYLRARRGAKGVMSDMKNYNAMQPAELFQYDVRQYYSYIAEPGVPAKPIVVGGRYQAGNGKPPPGNSNPDQGLFDLGPAAQQMTDTWDSHNANFAIPYFKHATLNAAGTSNDQGTPRSKDSFILISAGADRIFGTNDDLASFGTVGPD
jgi:prepilin-type N-terminal cleavage/methylation domain-containing protein